MNSLYHFHAFLFPSYFTVTYFANFFFHQVVTFLQNLFIISFDIHNLWFSNEWTYFFLLCWVFTVARTLSSCGEQGLRCGVGDSACNGFSFSCRYTGLKRCDSRALEHGHELWCMDFSCSMWSLPRPGIEPVSPASAGGFLPIVPPGKSKIYFFRGADMDLIFFCKNH